MSCVSQPITMYKGEDQSFILTFTDENGDRIDLTAYSVVEFEVKQNAGDPDPALIAKALGSGITKLAQTGTTLGQVQLDLVGADTASLVAQLDKWDVVAVDGAGVRHVAIPPQDFDLREVVNVL